MRIETMLWTHFYVAPSGRISLFVPDSCETCGAPIQAANSVTGADSPAHYRALGMTQVTELPEEGFYCDELDQEACYTCNGIVPAAEGA